MKNMGIGFAVCLLVVLVCSGRFDQAASLSVITITSTDSDLITETNQPVFGTCQTGLTVNFSGAGWLSPATAECIEGVFSAKIAFTSADGIKNLVASQTNAQGLTVSASRNFIRDTKFLEANTFASTSQLEMRAGPNH